MISIYRELSSGSIQPPFLEPDVPTKTLAKSSGHCRNRGHDGDDEQNIILILVKQRSRHHSLLGKTMENQKQDKASSQNWI